MTFILIYLTLLPYAPILSRKKNYSQEELLLHSTIVIKELKMIGLEGRTRATYYCFLRLQSNLWKLKYVINSCCFTSRYPEPQNDISIILLSFIWAEPLKCHISNKTHKFKVPCGSMTVKITTFLELSSCVKYPVRSGDSNSL